VVGSVLHVYYGGSAEMTLDEQLEILQAAKRGEKIEFQHGLFGLYWYPTTEMHPFNFAAFSYRIADPYAELKAAAKDPTKELWVRGIYIVDNPDWGLPPEQYEIRDKPKAKKVVKYLCWQTCSGRLDWWIEDTDLIYKDSWIRRPAFDKECEVEDA
jgi:hypothetical protein